MASKSGDVEQAKHAASAADVTPYDPDRDVPDPDSEWGWNGGFPRGSMIAGVSVVIILLLMMIGFHQGRVEDLWLIGTAAAVALGLILHVRKQRNAWRR